MLASKLWQELQPGFIYAQALQVPALEDQTHLPSVRSAIFIEAVPGWAHAETLLSEAPPLR